MGAKSVPPTNRITRLRGAPVANVDPRRQQLKLPSSGFSWVTPRSNQAGLSAHIWHYRTPPRMAFRILGGLFVLREGTKEGGEIGGLFERLAVMS